MSFPIGSRPDGAFLVATTDMQEAVRLILDSAVMAYTSVDDRGCDGLVLALAAILHADEKPARDLVRKALEF